MNKLRVLLATIFLVGSVVIGVTPAAGAALCNGGPGYIIYENSGFGGRNSVTCYPTNHSNYASYPIPDCGLVSCSTCNGGGTYQWNDCVSSIKVFGASATRVVCFFYNSGYTGSNLRLGGGDYSSIGAANDQISSSIWDTNGGTCTS